VAGTCNPSSGVCSTPNAPDNTSCGAGLGLCLTGACNIPRFTRLGFGRYPVALSGDGSITVGTTEQGDPFRWTRVTGFVTLPGTDCSVSAMSTDGVYTVGACGGETSAARWMGTSVPVNMGIPFPFTHGGIFGANASGSVLAGRVYDIANAASARSMIWRNGTSPTALVNAASVTSSYAVAVNADGSVIAGTARVTASGMDQAYRWTQAGGMVLIPYLAGGAISSVADVSADGNKVVGTSTATGGNRAFLWNAGALTAMVVPGDTASFGFAISDDGTTVGGRGSSGAWLSVNGGTPQLVGTTLAALGIDLASFGLRDVTDVSANGKVVVGTGSEVDGDLEGWIAVLP